MNKLSAQGLLGEYTVAVKELLHFINLRDSYKDSWGEYEKLRVASHERVLKLKELLLKELIK